MHIAHTLSPCIANKTEKCWQQLQSVYTLLCNVALRIIHRRPVQCTYYSYHNNGVREVLSVENEEKNSYTNVTNKSYVCIAVLYWFGNRAEWGNGCADVVLESIFPKLERCWTHTQCKKTKRKQKNGNIAGTIQGEKQNNKTSDKTHKHTNS